MTHTKEDVRRIVDQHNQISNRTCILSSVEMTLKLLEKVPSTYYDLQNSWTKGSYADFDGRTIQGVTFHRVNLADRGDNFPIDKLFNRIDLEIEAGKFVMIALCGSSDEGSCFHSYVIFGKDQTNDYVSVTKASLSGRYVTQFDDNIKNRVRKIGGTDILIYTT